MNLTPLPLPAELRAAYDAAGMQHVRRYSASRGRERWSVIVSRDPLGHNGDDPRWHVSVAGERDVPPWSALVAIAHELRPGVCFVLGLPPRSWWINTHPHCLHLYETHDAHLEEQWRIEGKGDEPT